MNQNISDFYNPWNITVDSFRDADSGEQRLRHLLTYAILAPSVQNSQPWLFHVEEDFVELHLDRSRKISALDPHAREAVMSCGAALCHLQIAMRHYGYYGGVEMFPEPAAPDFLARVHLGFQASAQVEENQLFQAITKRRTNRLPFTDDPVPDGLLEELQVLAEREGIEMRILKSQPVRKAFAELVAKADRQQWSSRSFRSSFAAWQRGDRSPGQDGIPSYSIGGDNLLGEVGVLDVKCIDLGEEQAARDHEIITHSPAIVILETAENQIDDWLVAGQALAQVLLRARVSNVWASFLNQPLRVPTLAGQLRDILQTTTYPQTVLRLGVGQNIRPTPRRPLKDVLV